MFPEALVEAALVDASACPIVGAQLGSPEPGAGGSDRWALSGLGSDETGFFQAALAAVGLANVRLAPVSASVAYSSVTA